MSKIQNCLQIGANINILLGLVLVGTQINQSNAIAAAKLLSNNLESTNEREIGLFVEASEDSVTHILYDDENPRPVDHTRSTSLVATQR